MENIAPPMWIRKGARGLAQQVGTWAIEIITVQRDHGLS